MKVFWASSSLCRIEHRNRGCAEQNVVRRFEYDVYNYIFISTVETGGVSVICRIPPISTPCRSITCKDGQKKDKKVWTSEKVKFRLDKCSNKAWSSAYVTLIYDVS